VETNPPSISKKDIKAMETLIFPKDTFYIRYQEYSKDSTNKINYFNFSLPPAIETTMQYSASGPFRGNSNVPEVKAGIPIRTVVKHRIINFLGNTPITQTIGVESSFLTLVGAFIGNESSTSEAKTSASLNPVYVDPNSDKDSAYTKAKLFDEKVVQPGRPIRVFIKTQEPNKKTSTINLAGTITDFRLYAVRRNKAYYSITISITK
jgi:hypothetical protein